MERSSSEPSDGPDPLDALETHRRDVASLTHKHELFAELLERNGLPPLWRRPATFATLVRFILEQQVSLASAAAVFARLETRLGGLTPDGVIGSSPEQMRADGFSHQKSGYVTGIAETILSGELDVADLANDSVRGSDRLLAIRGVGPWTAACFRLFVSGDRDMWPTGDRALCVSMSRVMDLEEVPQREVADSLAEDWRPHRSTAAKMLWHDYLGGRDYVSDPNAGFIAGTGKVPS